MIFMLSKLAICSGEYPESEDSGSGVRVSWIVSISITRGSVTACWRSGVPHAVIKNTKNTNPIRILFNVSSRFQILGAKLIIEELKTGINETNDGLMKH